MRRSHFPHLSYTQWSSSFPTIVPGDFRFLQRQIHDCCLLILKRLECTIVKETKVRPHGAELKDSLPPYKRHGIHMRSSRPLSTQD